MDSDTNKKDLDWMMEEVITSMNKNSYEKLVVTFDRGRIIHIIREESLKPPSFYRQVKKSS